MFHCLLVSKVTVCSPADDAKYIVSDDADMMGVFVCDTLMVCGFTPEPSTVIVAVRRDGLVLADANTDTSLLFIPLAGEIESQSEALLLTVQFFELEKMINVVSPPVDVKFIALTDKVISPSSF